MEKSVIGRKDVINSIRRSCRLMRSCGNFRRGQDIAVDNTVCKMITVQGLMRNVIPIVSKSLDAMIISGK